MKTECVIFDCDGLMFDTETVANQCWRDIASRYGVQLNDEFFYRIIGCGHQDVYKRQVYRHRRIHTTQISGGLSRTKHLLFR